MFIADHYLYILNMTENTKKSLPKKWTDAEEEKLLALVKEKKTDEEIAKELGRSVGAQCIRRSQIAVRMSKDGKPNSTVCDVCGLSEEELEKQLGIDKKKDAKKSSTNSKSKTSRDGGIMERTQDLKDIVKQLNELVQSL